LLLDTLDLRVRPNLDAVCAVLLFVEARELFACDAREHAIEGLHDGHALSELREDRRGFEADVTAADDDDGRRALELVLQSVDVGARSHRVDAAQIVTAA